jgi:zinc transport system permease protein
MPEFMWIAALGGLLTSLMTAVIGTFMLWRRMTYLGDALAHTALLGLALGLWLSLPLELALIVIMMFVALIIALNHRQKDLSIDVFIAIAAHSSLALGLLTISFLPSARLDLMGYLFGDLLNLTPTDLIWLTLVAIIVLGWMIMNWRALVLSSLNHELTKLAGLKPERLQWILTLLIALVIAVSIKLVGALLMTALLITPAAIARAWSHSPQQMMVSAVLVSVLAVWLGLGLSYYWDFPTAASIVSLLFAGFVLTRLWQRLFCLRH